jgi:hypothetical protein
MQSGNISIAGKSLIKTTIGTGRITKETQMEAPIIYETFT